MSARCTFAHVDLAALQSNFRALGRFLAAHAAAPSAPGIVAVVKANAYYGALLWGSHEDAGAMLLACADIEEAIVLRQAGRRFSCSGRRRERIRRT
jgi:alanine racemase